MPIESLTLSDIRDWQECERQSARVAHVMDSVPASPVMASSRLFAVFSFQGLMKHHLQICLVAQASPLGLRARTGDIGRVNSYRHRRGRATLLSLFEDSREGRRTALGCRARQPRCRLLAMVKPPLRFFRLFQGA